MTSKLPGHDFIESPELDFTGCVTLDDFFKRVEVVLVQAGGVHQQQHITAQEAVHILDERKPVKSAHPLSEDKKALIVANAVFPVDENLSFYLQVAINRSTCHNIDPEERGPLIAALKAKGYPELVNFMELLVKPAK